MARVLDITNVHVCCSSIASGEKAKPDEKEKLLVLVVTTRRRRAFDVDDDASVRRNAYREVAITSWTTQSVNV